MQLVEAEAFAKEPAEQALQMDAADVLVNLPAGHCEQVVDAEAAA